MRLSRAELPPFAAASAARWANRWVPRKGALVLVLVVDFPTGRAVLTRPADLYAAWRGLARRLGLPWARNPDEVPAS